MAARFVNIDHDTPLLLPPNRRDWVPDDHLIHFILNPAVEIHHEAHEGHEVKNLRGFLAGIRTHLLGDAVAECGFCTMP